VPNVVNLGVAVRKFKEGMHRERESGEVISLIFFHEKGEWARKS
jgi:hypothetical protein